MVTENFKYKIISFSPNKASHEQKKEWLVTQGVFFGDYDLQNIPGPGPWTGLNFYWCFDNPEIATMFKLKWEQAR